MKANDKMFQLDTKQIKKNSITKNQIVLKSYSSTVLKNAGKSIDINLYYINLKNKIRLKNFFFLFEFKKYLLKKKKIRFLFYK